MIKIFSFNNTIELEEYKVKVNARFSENTDGDLDLLEHNIECVNDIDVMEFRPGFVMNLEIEVGKYLVNEQICVEEVQDDDH